MQTNPDYICVLQSNKINGEGNFMSSIISKFDSMIIDMEYDLCIPSIHTTYKGENIIIDFSGGIRSVSENFSEDKVKRLVEWVDIHSEEIITNHIRKGCNKSPNRIKSML